MVGYASAKVKSCKFIRFLKSGLFDQIVKYLLLQENSTLWSFWLLVDIKWVWHFVLFRVVLEVDQFQEVTVSLLGNTQKHVWRQSTVNQILSP
jgi:hypothetical protein